MFRSDRNFFSIGKGVPQRSIVRRTESPVPFDLVFVACGIGAVLALMPSIEQDVVEGALVVAGIVSYPPQSAMGQYYLGVWTLLHQAAAFSLWIGVPDTVVDNLFCMVPVALRCGGYAMLIYGFSKRPTYSLTGAVILYASGFLMQLFGSPDYSINSRLGVPNQYTYGITAYSLTAWIFGALAGGRNVLAGFSTAVLIAIHPAIGCYLTGIIAGVLILRHRLLHELPTRGIMRGFALGSVVMVLSLVIFLMTRPSPGSIDVVAYDAYMKYWDAHRSTPIDPTKAISVLMAVAAFSAFLVGAGNRRIPAGVASVAILTTTVVSGVLYFAVHLAPDHFPRVVLAAMPGRLLDIHACVAGAVALGLTGWGLNQISHMFPPAGAETISSNTFGRALARVRPGQLWYIQAVVLLVALFAPMHISNDVLAAAGVFTRRSQRPGWNEAFWFSVRQANIKGAVLTSYGASVPALHKGHLQVLLNTTAINAIPYAPSAAGEIARIVTRGYGVSFLHPPDNPRTIIQNEAAYWSRLAPEQWIDLSRELGFVAVVAPASWQVRLPARITGPEFTLYDVPASP